MENQEFYVKYLTNQPVKVETHIDSQRARREFPLNDVADLVAAFQALPNSPVASVFAGNITLLVDETVIPGNTLLHDIQQSYEQPLVIRSLTDSITMDEYMKWSLPKPIYDNPVSRSNTSGNTWNRPTHLWSDFKQSAVSWIDDNHQQHSQRVQRPVYVPRVITEEVQTLQPFILDNLLDVSAKCFIPPSEFNARRQITSCVGEPDHLMTRNGEIIAIVEEKGNWTLSTGDIFNSTSACASAVNQLYHYMRLNHRQYGILSSYENTWFVYRSQERKVREDDTGHETLFVSEGIPFDAKKPTVQQCLSYFNSILNHDYMESPPTAGSAIRISRTSSIRNYPTRFSREGSPWSSEIQINQEPQDFDAYDFKLDTVLGEGRCKVYLDYYGSSRIALKVADIAKHGEILPELLNEVSVYEQLSGLQGNGIPRFVCHGFVEEVLYCVGVSICGTVANGFTEQQKQKLLETLKRIHEAGILHNDIKNENILVDESGNPYIIDFGFSTRNCSSEAQMEETNLLLGLFEST